MTRHTTRPHPRTTGRVVVLTHAYPYGSWEPYLGAELATLAATGPVDLIALSVRRDQKNHRRRTPAGVRIHTVSYLNKPLYALIGLTAALNPDTYRELHHHYTHGTLNPTTLARIGEYISRSHYEAARTIAILARRGYRTDDQFTLYSYRMDYQLLVLRLVHKAFPHARLIARGHGTDLYHHAQPGAVSPFRHLTLGDLDQAWAISTHGATYLRETYPHIADKVHVHRLGVAASAPNPTPGDTTHTIASCSAAVDLKRIHLIAEALQHLPSNYRWIHFGDGPTLDTVRTRITQLGLNDRVSLPGNVPNNEVRDYYTRHHVDCFINCSTREGVPVSIMEAFAAGIPAAATAVGGNTEIVTDHHNGILLPADPTPTDIANAITHITTTPHYRHAAHTTWAQHYDAATAYTTTAAILRGETPNGYTRPADNATTTN